MTSFPIVELYKRATQAKFCQVAASMIAKLALLLVCVAIAVSGFGTWQNNSAVPRLPLSLPPNIKKLGK